MKEFVTFQGIWMNQLSNEAQQYVHNRFPECFCPATSGGFFQGGYPAGHPRLIEIMKFLASHGWHPKPGWFSSRKEGSKQYWLRIERKYTKQDFDALEYFNFGGGGVPWGGGGLPHAPCTVLATKGMKPDDIRMVGVQRRVVPQRVRAIFESEGVRQVTFLPTMLCPQWGTTGKHTEWTKLLTWEEIHEEPWWELSSAVTLPPLSPTCRLATLDGDDYDPDKPFRGLYVEEGNYEQPEMHYRRSDLAKVPAFDIALTHENIGAGNRDEIGTLICSQRFRQVCLKHKLKIGFWPVRVDEM